MKEFCVKSSAVAGIFVLSLVGAMDAVAAQPVKRITGEISNVNTFSLSGNVHPRVAGIPPLGPVDPSMPVSRITLHFSMTAAQQSSLDQLLKEQQTRGSREYHKWLSPEQFGERFGLDQADIQKIRSWLEDQGFSNIEVAKSRNAISFSGTAGQVQAAFQTALQRYNLNGELHFANAGDPQLPKALDGVVESIRGLNDFHPKPRGIRHVVEQPRFTSSISGNHFLVPDDFATIYGIQALYGNGIDGTGQTIAVSGQTDIALSDIEAFRSAAGLPPNDPELLLVPNSQDPGTIAGDEGEADLDIEWSGGIARNAKVIYVYSQDAFTSATYAIQNDVAPVLVLTYGLCEAQQGAAEMNSMNSIFQQANAEGITISVAAGDNGAADCDGNGSSANGPTLASQGLAVDFPASSPYVTGVGGTELNDCTGTYWNTTNNTNGGSASGYIPEVAWNDTNAALLTVSCGTVAGVLSASGGGASTVFTKPSWQTGTGVPNDGHRDVPDIAFAASPQHDGYLTCTGGSCVSGFRDGNQNLNVVGGTSASAPTFAGMVALLNQQLQSSQGNVNPVLYAVASHSTDAFHDITQGTNEVPCKASSPDCPASGLMGFSAGTGYDQATGLGSINAQNLFNEWTSDFQVTATPATLSIAAGASGTSTVQVTALNNFSGTVSFTCAVSSGLANVTCSVPGTVSGTGTATLTITAAQSAFAPKMIPFRPGRIRSGPMLFGFLLITGTAIGMWLLFPRRRVLTAAAGLSCIAILAGCGGGNSGSTTQTVQETVPNVLGDTQAVASTAISGAGLSVGTVTQQSSTTVASGDVISQSPVAGTVVTQGTAVSLVVSTGPANIAVPNVVGDTQSAATNAITGAQLMVGTITQQASSTVAQGDVISESPAAGTLVSQNSSVNLVISSGPPKMVAVPNLVGMSQGMAVPAITAASLTLGTVTQQASGTVPNGYVISQSPAAASQASEGSAVNLVVSSGPAEQGTVTVTATSGNVSHTVTLTVNIT